MSDRLFSLPVITCVRNLIGGFYDKDTQLGISMGTHAQLEDFFHAADIEIADEPSIKKKTRATIDRFENDPAGAITSACSTVESVCKCLLDELKQPYPIKKDIQGLSNEVAKHLGLSPSRTDLPEDLAKDLKQILGGLQTVANGIGALRT